MEAIEAIAELIQMISVKRSWQLFDQDAQVNLTKVNKAISKLELASLVA